MKGANPACLNYNISLDPCIMPHMAMIQTSYASNTNNFNIPQDPRKKTELRFHSSGAYQEYLQIVWLQGLQK
jgi:hypothetical protein